MRFRRATDATPNAQVKVSDRDPSRLRRGRFVRLGVVFVSLTVGIVAILFIRNSWITADGIVVGDLAEVAPIAEGRITDLHKHCLDFVSRGEPVVEIDNESVAAGASQQLQELEIEAAQARADQQVAGGEAKAAQSYHDAQAAVLTQLQGVYDAQVELMKGKYVASLVVAKARADVAQAEANAQAAQYLVESKLDDEKKAETEADQTEARISAFRKTPALMGHYSLLASKAGYLTQCNADIGAVVNTDATLYRIFNPNDAYVIAFIDPKDAPRITKGQNLKVAISGMTGQIDGQVSGFYPELSGLPDFLTRYFWQREKWSQFEPVRIDFVRLSDSEERALRASAQVSISFWSLPKTGFFAPISSFFGDGAA